MQHPLIDWLEERAREALNHAAEYRAAVKGESPDAARLLEAFDENREELLAWAKKDEERVRRFHEWSRLFQDMISCGLEECALKYYDAKQAVAPHLMPPRPEFTFAPQLEAVMGFVEGRIESTENAEDLEELKAIETTMTALFSVGLSEIALQYYSRKRQQQEVVHLGLPDPTDVDDEQIRAAYPPASRIALEYSLSAGHRPEQTMGDLKRLKQKAVEIITKYIETARTIRKQGPATLEQWNAHLPPERQYVNMDHLMEERFMRSALGALDFIMELGLLDMHNKADQETIKKLSGAIFRL